MTLENNHNTVWMCVRAWCKGALCQYVTRDLYRKGQIVCIFGRYSIYSGVCTIAISKEYLGVLLGLIELIFVNMFRPKLE